MYYSKAQGHGMRFKLKYAVPSANRLITYSVFPTQVLPDGETAINMRGIDHGFRNGDEILLRLPNYGLPMQLDGELVDITGGFAVPDLPSGFSDYFWKLDGIVPISWVDVNETSHQVSVRVTFDITQAHYIMIVSPRTTIEDTKLPRKARKAAIAHVVRTVTGPHFTNHAYITYTVLPFAFPYHNTIIKPVLESYRMQLIEEHMEKCFLLTETHGETSTFDNAAEPNIAEWPFSYHYEDGASREQAFAILSNGRLLKPTVNPNDIETDLFDGAKAAQMEVWPNLPEDAWVVKYECLSTNTKRVYSFVKRSETLYRTQADRMEWLAEKMRKWENATFNTDKLGTRVLFQPESTKTWLVQLMEENMEIRSEVERIMDGTKVPEVEFAGEDKTADGYNFEAGV